MLLTAKPSKCFVDTCASYASKSLRDQNRILRFPHKSKTINIQLDSELRRRHVRGRTDGQITFYHSLQAVVLDNPQRFRGGGGGGGGGD